MPILYEKFEKYQVPASSAEDSRRRYTKPDYFAQRDLEYQATVLQAARDNLVQLGYTITSRHDSVISKAPACYKLNEQEISRWLTARITMSATVNLYPWLPIPSPPANGMADT